MMNHKMNGKKKRRRRVRRVGSGRRFRPYYELNLEEAGVEDFEFGDFSELDWNDPDVGFRRNMLGENT